MVAEQTGEELPRWRNSDVIVVDSAYAGLVETRTQQICLPIYW